MTSFRVGPSEFQLDGRPYRIISGAMHYFRVLAEQHLDRLTLLRQMGLNTVETYVAWNVHEPVPGRYSWRGLANLEGFLDAAAEAGLYVIVRPGPYICAEWDNGGLPAWLLADRSIRLRAYDPAYLEAVDRWFDQLVPRLAARQVTRGGNVLLVQVENEYGTYGTDRAYLDHLAGGLRARGIDVPLFTSDQPREGRLSGGSLPNVLASVNFADKPDEAFAALRRARPDGPLLATEYWAGWYDHWGDDHHVRSPQSAAKTLDQILAKGASVNVYMAHGGSNFGFWAGADRKVGGELEPIVTSYDYDAPLDEAGRPTEKYWALREVIGRYTELPDDGPPRERTGGPAEGATARGADGSRAADADDTVDHDATDADGAADGDGGYEGRYVGGHYDEHGRYVDDGGGHDGGYGHDARSGRGSREHDGTRTRLLPPGDIAVSGYLPLRVALERIARPARTTATPMTFEELGLAGGLARYRCRLSGPREEADLVFDGLGDLAHVWVDETFVATVAAGEGVPLAVGQLGIELDIIVTAYGRVGFGPYLGDRKGIVGGVRHDGAFLHKWESMPVPLDPLPVLEFGPLPDRPWPGPAFWRAGIELDDVGDGFLALPGWDNGIVWVNGFCLGRYDSASGPQRTLYVPWPLLRPGGNEIAVLELGEPHHEGPPRFAMRAEPDLGRAAEHQPG